MHAIFESYITDALAHRKPRTQRNCRTVLMRFDEWLADKGIEAAAAMRDEIRSYLADLVAAYKPATVSRHMIYVRAAYNDAVEKGDVAKNPTVGVTRLLPPIERAEPRVYAAKELGAIVNEVTRELTEDELRSFVGNPGCSINGDAETLRRRHAQDRVMIYLLALTGCRVAELLGLRMEKPEVAGKTSYVDWESRQLSVFGKGDKRRYVPVHPILMSLLESWREERPEHVFVIESSWRRQMSPQSWQTHVKGILKRAGVRNASHPSHSFRKTLCTSLTRCNVRRDVIDGIFGWSASDIGSKYYTGRSPEDAHAGIALAYSDMGRVFPEQPHLEAVEAHAALDGELLAEVERLRLENENLQLKLKVASLEAVA